MRVRSRARGGRVRRRSSSSDGDGNGLSSGSRSSGNRLDSLGYSLDFWSSRASGLSVDIDHLVADFAANDPFLGIGEGCSVCQADGGESGQNCGGRELRFLVQVYVKASICMATVKLKLSKVAGIERMVRDGIWCSSGSG
jgi:hypothetical protein